ncbi:MAG TPA: MlaD family protein [Candidatus Omnitrophota bacterium]|nr:MlaD family protein [Candidatus Omnitrophota bacterium]
MPKESNLELKVGAFVVSAFILLTAFIFSISDFSAFQKGENLKVIFGFANGLKKAAPVRFAGVDCGRVKETNVFYDKKEGKTKVQVDIWLKAGTDVPVDSVVTINQLGLLGEKYVEIIPGASVDLLRDGSALIGKDPIAMEKISEMVTQLAQKVDKSIEGFNSVVNNRKNQESLENTLLGISDIVTNVREGKGTVGRLFFDESLFENLHDLTSDLKDNPWKLLYRPKPLREKK